MRRWKHAPHNTAGGFGVLAVERTPFHFQEPAMTVTTARLTSALITAMSESELLDAEFSHHVRFIELDGAERRAKGPKYNLMRGPEELVTAWDQWGRLTRAAIARELTPRRLPKAGH
jgi:hypothetical protein